MGKDFTGPSWNRLDWYLRRVIREHRLGRDERVLLADEALDRTRAAVAATPDADPYALAWNAINELLVEHHVDDREPIPDPDPVDLDVLVDPRNGCGPVDPCSPIATGMRVAEVHRAAFVVPDLRKCAQGNEHE